MRPDLATKRVAFDTTLAPDVLQKTLAEEGFVNEATCCPEVLVKVMTLPDVRPKYLVFGWSVNGTTVSTLPV